MISLKPPDTIKQLSAFSSKNLLFFLKLSDILFFMIASVLSIAMYSGMPFIVAYSGSKAALAIMTKNIANSVSGHQIRVNALNIGWSDTPAEHEIQTKVHNKNEGSPSCFLIFSQNQNPSRQLFLHNPIDHHYSYHPILEEWLGQRNPKMLQLHECSCKLIHYPYYNPDQMFSCISNQER